MYSVLTNIVPAVCNIPPYLLINWNLNGFATWPSLKVLCEIALKSVNTCRQMQTTLCKGRQTHLFNVL